MGLLDKQLYDTNCSYKAFILKKNELTMAGYIEYLKLKELLYDKPERRKHECKS